MSEWQDIETAPKDGTAVLLWTEDFPGAYKSDMMPCMVTAHWSEYYRDWQLEMAWGYECDETVYGNPRFWQPAPKPPTHNP